MELNDTEVEQVCKKAMDLPGMDKSHNSYLMLENGIGPFSYMKFMSDGGSTDSANGNTFFMHMVNNEADFVSTSPRHFKVADDELRRVFLS